MNHFIVSIAVGILKSFAVVCFGERRREIVCVCVRAAIFILKGHHKAGGTFVVLIVESERRGLLHCCYLN